MASGSAIDEFQRGGDPLLLALKARLDSDPTRGEVVLAGPTQFLAMRTISETLTGRVGIIELLPFSVGAPNGVEESFVAALFGRPADALVGRDSAAATRADYASLIATGGFPELVLGPRTNRFRSTWCETYLRTVTAVANVGQVADVRRPEALFTVLSQAAARSGGELVVADLARDVQLDETTIHNYLQALATLYLVRSLPAWAAGHTGRAKKRPVLHLIDTALAAHLLGATPDGLARIDSPWFGPLLESFVVGEVAKQATWGDRGEGDVHAHAGPREASGVHP